MELSTKDAARSFSEVVNRVRYASERITITRRGKPVAALVPLADLAQLEEVGPPSTTGGVTPQDRSPAPANSGARLLQEKIQKKKSAGS